MNRDQFSQEEITKTSVPAEHHYPALLLHRYSSVGESSRLREAQLHDHFLVDPQAPKPFQWLNLDRETKAYFSQFLDEHVSFSA